MSQLHSLDTTMLSFQLSGSCTLPKPTPAESPPDVAAAHGAAEATQPNDAVHSMPSAHLYEPVHRGAPITAAVMSLGAELVPRGPPSMARH